MQRTNLQRERGKALKSGSKKPPVVTPDSIHCRQSVTTAGKVAKCVRFVRFAVDCFQGVSSTHASVGRK